MVTIAAHSSRKPAQPRPRAEEHRAQDLTINVDVLEIIAENACGMVKDACALRAANKSFRRAVDTTVRRWVYEDQPELRRTPPNHEDQPELNSASHATVVAAPATLRLEPPDGALDAVRIAFTCDAFRGIVRIVVVAFALDGAKDELHEAADCGLRPILPDVIPLQPEFGVTIPARGAVKNPLTAAPEHMHGALRAGLTRACVWPELLACSACGFSASDRPWIHLSRLQLSDDAGRWGDAEYCHRAAALVRALGPQLTELDLVGSSGLFAPAIAACTQLRKFAFTFDDAEPLPEAARSGVCDALIASGAPIETVEVDFDAADGTRLLEHLTTIKRAVVRSLTRRDLPPLVAQRLHRLNHKPLPSSPEIWVAAASEWAAAAQHHVTLLAVEHGVPSLIAGLDTAYPQLRTLQLYRLFDVAEGGAFGIGNIRFPASLRELTVRMAASPGPATALFRLVGSQAQQLCDLEDVSIDLSAGSVDVGPLAALARSLKKLNFGLFTEAPWEGEHLATLEATVSQLVGLQCLTVAGLPTARCLLAGRHIHLRQLNIHNIDAKDAKFATLVKACPGLNRARGEEPLSVDPPAGWKLTKIFVFGAVAFRIPFGVC